MPFAQNNQRRTSRWGSSSASNKAPYSVDSIDRQISNVRTRAEDSGYTADPDKRNWLERLTNLPEGQNAFLDTLELIGRPGQAVLNMIDKVPDKERTAGQAAWRGFSGADRVRGTDIIEKRGITDPVPKWILGTATEILTDPLNLVPGGAIAKGAKMVGRPVGRGFAASYKALEGAAPSLKQLRENTIQPRLSQAKDAVGTMFNRDYKIDETLSGGKSDFLKERSTNAENSRRFMQEESLKAVADSARLAGGVDTGTDVGRAMEAPLTQLDEVGNVPKSFYTEKPDVEVPQVPKVQEAARTLVKSNSELRQVALDNGIQINELEGYMTHVWSKAERELRKHGKVASIDQGRYGAGNPNKKILNERKYEGTVEEINKDVGREMFEPNAYFATGIGKKRLIDYISAVKFRREVLSNSDFAMKYEKGAVMPANSEVIDTHNYTFLKDADDMLEGIPLTDNVSGKYVVTKAAKRALDRFQKVNTDEGTKAFIKAFDGATSMWKRFALFSFGYHARNAMGAMFNNYVGGMNLYNGDLVKYTGQAAREVTNAVRGKESVMFREYRQQGLNSSALSNVEFITHADPEKAMEKTIKMRSRDTKGQIEARLNPLRAFETSREVGDFIDQTNRFAAYKWAREKLNLSPEKAAEKVRTMQFDYTKLAPFEQNIMVRVVPFYRWMRNNIPYQIRQFLHDPRKYAAVNKIRLNAQDAYGIDEENTPDWMKQQFAIPVSDDKFLSLGLPLGDLTRVADPLKMGVDALNPLVKTPIELSTNRNFFYGKPIEKFEDQEKQFRVPGTDMEFGVPIKAAYAIEQGTGQIGRGFSQYLQKPEDVDQDTKFRMPRLGINSLVKPFDVEQAEFFQKLQELGKLQDYLDYIEQQSGQRPRAVNEIRGR